jgi:hypothetical protein
MVQNIMSQEQIRIALKTHQRHLRAGDDLPTITEIAHYAGCHRDSIYALLNGDNVAYRTQYALSKAVKYLDEVCQQSSKTKLMHIKLSQNNARVGFGISTYPVLSSHHKIKGILL